ncbi:GntR family transcriptional regulator [Pseudonocardia sichuanensis]
MTPLRPIESVALGDRTFETLRLAIINGDLVPGEPLRDRQLAEALQVSRTPVREALHRLEAAGLVEPRGRAGWEVSPFTEQDVHEIFQMRMLLEPAGIDQLERDRDDEVIARIAGFFDDFSHPVPVGRYPEYFARDHAFHNLIVACSGNRRLRRTYAVMQNHIDRGRHFLTTAAAGRADETLDEHLAVALAIRDRDFAAARRELLHHLRTGEELMIETLRGRATSGQ